MTNETPKVSLYENQEYAVRETLRAFEEGRKVVAIASPTGSGKTVIGSAIEARSQLRGFYTSSQVSLVRQALADPNLRFFQPSTAGLVGRGNYDCERDVRLKRGTRAVPITAADAVCYELTLEGNVIRDPESGTPISCRYKRWSEENGLPTCDYYHDKALAEMSPLAITTLAYHTVAVSRYDSKFPGPKVGWNFGRLSGRPLLIVDEAHGLQKDVLRLLSQRWHDDSYPRGSYGKAWSDWTKEPEAVAIWDKKATDEEYAKAIDRLVEMLFLGDPDSTTDPQETKFLEELEADRVKLTQVAKDIRAGMPWVCHFGPGQIRKRDVAVLELTPVVPAPYLRRLLWDKAENIVVMSGSFLDVKQDLIDMGLDHLPARVVTLPSGFPPDNGPILRIPVARFTAQTKAQALPVILRALWAVLRLEKGRGVVHAQSFPNVDEMEKNVPYDLRSRMVFHQRNMDISREELIAEFQQNSKPGDVIASPSVTEGLDLPGQNQFVAFLKAPFADTSSEQVSRRMKMADGQEWYRRQTLVTTVQGRGRTLRSKSDTSRCLLLDEAHCELIARYWYILPANFLEAIRAGDRFLAAHPEYATAIREATKVRPAGFTMLPVDEATSPFEGIDFGALRKKKPLPDADHDL